MYRCKLIGQKGALPALAQFFAHTLLDIYGVKPGINGLDILILLNKPHSRFLAHSGHAGDVIRAVAHQSLEVNDVLWLKAVLVKKQLWSILCRRCLPHTAFDMADMRCFTYKLKTILITGNYAAVPACCAAPHSDRTEQIIGLVALKLKAQDAHCVKHLLEYRHLNGKLLGHALALSLISGVSQVPERRRFEVKCNTHGLGLFIIKQLA